MWGTGWESTRGNNNRTRKLSEQSVRVIKFGSVKPALAASVMKVSKQTINDIRAGRRWSHVTRTLEECDNDN